MIILKLTTIFLLVFVFLIVRKIFKFSKSKKPYEKRKYTSLKKDNLNKWMNLTKKERYNLLKKDSLSYFNKRKVLLEEIRKEYKRVSQSDAKKLRD